MPICRLCLEDRLLRISHFLPAAIYNQLRAPHERNSNPVLMTGEAAIATSRQITDHLLCGDCEQRFSRLGEAWVLGSMHRPNGFRLQDVVAALQPIGSNAEFAYYSTAGIAGIDMDALVYFAMSVFWRASAHRWKDFSGERMGGIDLGPYEEHIRRFLLGGCFPDHTVVLVSIWPTREVIPAAHTPRRGRALGYHAFNFLIPGIEFKLLTGRQIPDLMRKACSQMSPERFLFSSTRVIDDMMGAFTRLAESGQPSRGLLEMVRRR
jgi:hypothetical protein